MNTAEKLMERRNSILKEIVDIGPMRRGSMTPQFVEAVNKKGQKYRRGPYTLYSFKDKGKTVSKRITRDQDEKTYREQIEAFRQFQSLSSELVEVSQSLADSVVSGVDCEKKTSGQ